MRPATVTLLPMFAAAALVVLAGERLAREEVETRTPADRERLVDFASSLESELDRLDALFEGHLADLAARVGTDDAAQLESRAREQVSAIRGIQAFTGRKKVGELALPAPGPSQRLPEVVLEGDRPLNQENAIVIPIRLLEPESDRRQGWLPGPRPEHAVYWTRTGLGDSLVSFLIDRQALDDQVETYLGIWMKDPLVPLREAGERLVVTSPTGHPLASSGEGRRGPAAVLLPIRTTLGDWRIQAWDRVSVTTRRDTATLTAAATVAAILALGGLALWLQQRRALRLAEERVSFVNRVSHELGTPLTNVALNLDLATETLEARPAESRRRLGIVTEEIERLARLVANVLTFSRQERRTLELDPQPCVPDDVVNRTLSSFRPALRRRDMKIECQLAAGERVLLDPDALGQIVGNLVSNVEKYAAEGGWLGVSTTLSEGALAVGVSDRGPGIPPDARERIFRPFERVRSEVNEGSSGTGLGLSIARDLATRMGGTLVLTAASEGTHFELRLPAPPALAVVPEDKHSAA